jgi:translation initiation factor 3 subunit E
MLTSALLSPGAEDEILKAKIALLGKTNMVDYAMDIHKSLYKTEDVPPGTLQHCARVFFAGFSKACEEQASLIGLLLRPEVCIRAVRSSVVAAE